MVNIGLDFGSTYTVVSAYRDGEVKPILLTQGTSPFIPSVVLKDESEEFDFGLMAKQRVSESEATIYKGFKMMMTQTDEQKRKERGYDKQHTPEWITKKYLEEILEETLEVLEEETIGRLVVGVPANWYEKKVPALECCTKLRDICRSFSFVEEVQIVNEPAAASAYFTWNYKKVTGEDFCGYLFVVDYGGGTLDITINQVSCDGEKSNVIEIDRTGAGENEEGQMGKAGIAYMEAVVSSAIEQCLAIKPEIDNEFYYAVDQFEQALQSKSRKVRQFYQDHAFLELEELEEPFFKIRYMGKQIPITYGLMASVYRIVIEPVLEEKLNLMTRVLKKYEIDYENTRSKTFKIVLVGGFCNFYLTRKQIEDYFRFTSQDQRWEHKIADQTDCENAISLGTALIANEVLSIPDSAPYSIGIYLEEDGENYQYAIHYKEEITYEKPYFQVTPIDGKPKILIGTDVSKFAVKWRDDDKQGQIMELKEEWKEKLRKLPLFQKNDVPRYALGFSFDHSNVLSLYFQEYDDESQKLTEHIEKVELNKMGEIFSRKQLDR